MADTNDDFTVDLKVDTKLVLNKSSLSKLKREVKDANVSGGNVKHTVKGDSKLINTLRKYH